MTRLALSPPLPLPLSNFSLSLSLSPSLSHSLPPSLPLSRSLSLFPSLSLPSLFLARTVRVFSELSMKRGDTFYLIHKRHEDGWCLVRTPSSVPGGAVEGWVPGNFISKDGGKHALVDTKR